MHDVTKKLELCRELLESVVNQLASSAQRENRLSGMAEDDDERSAQGAD